MNSSVPVELTWNVHGLHMTALSWGNPQHPPILALHGWLDNAASFAPLAECLAEHSYVVALDLTGHGHSDWRSEDATYQIYDDLPQILAIVQQLGWSKFELLGHSRGAIISSFFAANFPEHIAHLVLLDGVAPQPLDADAFVTQMRKFVRDKERLLQREPRVYATEADAVSIRAKEGLTEHAAELIAMRNLRACEGGYTWRTDPRLRGASAVKMTQEQVDVLLSSLTMPTLLLSAEQGMTSGHSEYFAAMVERMPGAQRETFPGGHHFHMEAGVVTLAQRLQRFFAGP